MKIEHIADSWQIEADLGRTFNFSAFGAQLLGIDRTSAEAKRMGRALRKEVRARGDWRQPSGHQGFVWSGKGGARVRCLTAADLYQMCLDGHWSPRSINAMATLMRTSPHYVRDEILARGETRRAPKGRLKKVAKGDRVWPSERFDALMGTMTDDELTDLVCLETGAIISKSTVTHRRARLGIAAFAAKRIVNRTHEVREWDPSTAARLRKVEGLPWHVIGERYNLSAGAVADRLRRQGYAV